MGDHIATALETIYSGRYAKNIHYQFLDHFDIREFQMVKALAGASGQIAFICEQWHRLSGEGMQMQVSKVVSDDLMQTDFHEATKMEEIPWPGSSVEVYFEDPGLPTILLCNITSKQVEVLFPQLEADPRLNEAFMSIMQEKGMKLTTRVGVEMWEEFIRNGLIPPLPAGNLADAVINREDQASQSFMMQLAFKAFVFASIPQFKPAPLTRSQMSWGGKPGVKGRPQVPSLKVQYLPRVITGKASHSEPAAHAFKGRRGHIRYYRHERFTNKQGTWDFIAPVPGPDGKYPIRIIKVRKPHICDDPAHQAKVARAVENLREDIAKLE